MTFVQALDYFTNVSRQFEEHDRGGGGGGGGGGGEEGGSREGMTYKLFFATNDGGGGGGGAGGDGGNGEMDNYDEFFQAGFDSESEIISPSISSPVSFLINRFLN